MERHAKSTTPADIVAAYEAIVSTGDTEALAPASARMHRAFEDRTGAFGPEDPWFETRSRAFWDDALAGQGYATLAAATLGEDVRALAARFERAHRGFFVVEDVDERGAQLVDLWSGAEFAVRLLDETQALALEHADGAMDARVVAGVAGSDLFLLPGAYHHPADALDPALAVLLVARERGMTTGPALDALLRMELVLRSSSRVKTSFAYRVEALGG